MKADKKKPKTNNVEKKLPKKIHVRKHTKGPAKKIDRFKFTGIDGKEYELTPQQKLFVEIYMQMGATGVDAIIEAGYNVKNSKGIIDRKLASVMSADNLVKPSILAYINKLMPEYGYDDDNVERQHLFLVNQNADLAVKKGAIDSYYKLKGKFKEHNTQIATALDAFRQMDNDDLEQQINEKSKEDTD